MKLNRFISITLSAVTIMSLCACQQPVDVKTADAEKMTADEFVELFTEDENKAEKDNKGKIFEITGEVSSQNSDLSVTLSSSEKIDDSDCNLYFSMDSDKGNLPDLEKGDTIVIRGKFSKSYSYRLDFDDSVYIDSVEPTEPEKESSESSSEPEHGTSSYVDYIALKAKDDAETATDDDIKNALNWLKDNTENYFSGEENMEKTMYYGELLEYKYKDTGDSLEKIGWQAFKTVKYVYRGAESVTDDATHNNLMELKEMLENYQG